MAGTDCCQLVGDLDMSAIDGCVISINVSSSTEITDVCDTIQAGPTIGNVSITGYSSNVIYIGCPSQAGVSISWARRYDCDTNTLYFMHTGQGQSFIAGEVSGNTFVGDPNHNYVSLNERSDRQYYVMSASSTSGPTALYQRSLRLDGYGMNYTGDLFKFDTAQSLIFDNALNLGVGSWYLQSFNLSFNPGALPTASYSFLFAIAD